MIKWFNFYTYGIFIAFPIELGEKTVSIDVEAIDAPLEYNLLLGHSWFREMKEVISLVFSILFSPHQGKVITIDQLAYSRPDLRSNVGTNVSFFNDTLKGYASISAGVFKDSSLMDKFTLPPLDATFTPINMISLVTSRSLGSSDTWVVPRPWEIVSSRVEIPLSHVQLGPLSSPPGESITTSNHVSKRKKKRGRKRK